MALDPLFVPDQNDTAPGPRLSRLSLAQRAGTLAIAVAAGRAGSPAWAADGVAVPPHVAARGMTNASYWAFIDRIMAALDRSWDPALGMYPIGGPETVTNAALLTVHAIAARVGHRGAARADDRVVSLAERLCSAPAWSERKVPLRPDKMFHAPGWTTNMRSNAGSFDKAIDPKVALALEAAWRARATVGLPQDLEARIVSCIDRVARTTFFRYPLVRLNQFNWNAEIAAHAATVTGRTDLLCDDYRRQLARFADGIRRAGVTGYGLGAPNLGPGYRFHYLPHVSATVPMNLDSAEYANITIHGLAWYEQALRAGMRPLAPRHLDAYKAWLERVLFGYWTHSGFLNWDSGLGLARWQIGKTFAYSQQGLLAIAGSPAFHARPETGSWAKHLLDQGFRLYRRWAAEAGDGVLAAPTLNDVIGDEGDGVHGTMVFAARMAENAARAVDLGLGSMPSAAPPPFYAFDPDIGRLAVSTPTYSTALLCVNQAAVPYGGDDPVRLYDADGRPAATVAGVDTGAFGMVVADREGQEILASHGGRRLPSMRNPPLRVTRAPRGAGDAEPYPRRAYAAPFTRLESRVDRAGHGFAIRTRHAFLPDHLELGWTLRATSTTPVQVDVRFPTRGHAARILAISSLGERTALAETGRLPAAPVPIGDVAWFHLVSGASGYVLVPDPRHTTEARALAVVPVAQRFEPDPGPTLVIRLVDGERARRRTLAVRIAPARTTAEAERVAARLRYQ